jgi:FkbH-like protein
MNDRPALTLEIGSAAPVFSFNDLVNTRWTFGRRDGHVLTDSFRLGAAGFIEDYQHKNETSWKVAGNIVEIYQRNGDLMWTSVQMFVDNAGRKHITLKTPLDPAVEFILSEYAAPLGAADFLFPKDLRVTPTQFKQILLIGSCLTALYHEQFSRRFRGVKFDYVAYNFAGSLPANPPAPVNAYDLQYVQIPLRSILSDRIIWATRFNEPDFADAILNDGYGIIDVMLDAAMAYNQAHGLLSLVSNFIVPQMNAAPDVRNRNKTTDLAFIVRKFNDYLAEAVGRYKNAYLVDVNAVADSIGKRYVLDDMIYFYSHGAVHFQEHIDRGGLPRIEPIPPIAEFYESKRDEYIQAVYDQMIATYRIVRQTDQVKAVIFDLDNTLWRGQLAEHYRPGDQSWPKSDGWPMGIWEAIHHLRARGILVAICSKNDYDIVAKYWSNAVRPEFVSLKDFASVKINWLPKAENIKAICQEFNIKPKSVVFVDDNPVERAAVKAALPDIRVIGANPYLTRRILLWAPETQLAFLTKESARREDMVRSQIVREETRVAMSREEFLATLNCTLAFTNITDTDHPEFGRVLELINKTNQFNTTGQRWAHGEITEFLAGGGKILAFNVRDKFADYGLVGVLLLDENIISQFVMSCRVLGMDVEIYAVAHAVSLLRSNGAGAIAAPLIETPDNTPCRDVFTRSGFTDAEEPSGTHRYVLPQDKTCEAPPYIQIQ